MNRAILLPVQLWLAHAVAFFAHEYGHSFSAWALGFKAHPLVLNFGTLSLRNLLIMSEIDEKVDYAPIFAGGDGAAAALIAAAGVLTNFFSISSAGSPSGTWTRPGRAWHCCSSGCA